MQAEKVSAKYQICGLDWAADNGHAGVHRCRQECKKSCPVVRGVRREIADSWSASPDAVLTGQAVHRSLANRQGEFRVYLNADG